MIPLELLDLCQMRMAEMVDAQIDFEKTYAATLLARTPSGDNEARAKAKVWASPPPQLVDEYHILARKELAYEIAKKSLLDELQHTRTLDHALDRIAEGIIDKVGLEEDDE